MDTETSSGNPRISILMFIRKAFQNSGLQFVRTDGLGKLELEYGLVFVGWTADDGKGGSVYELVSLPDRIHRHVVEVSEPSMSRPNQKSVRKNVQLIVQGAHFENVHCDERFSVATVYGDRDGGGHGEGDPVREHHVAAISVGNHPKRISDDGATFVWPHGGRIERRSEKGRWKVGNGVWVWRNQQAETDEAPSEVPIVRDD